MIRCSFVWIVLGAGIASWADENAAPAIRQEDFDKSIAPLLAARCLECHSGKRAKGGLDLSRRDQSLQGGESGPAIVPGKPDESLLWERIQRDEMPPKHPLDAKDKALLKNWIAGGAPWGTDPIDRFRYTTAIRAGYNWWSLQPLVPVRPPDVVKKDWPRNELDRFILQQLEEHGLAPSPEANPRVLVRRLYYDLIGLPPAPEEVEKFAADPSPAAYEQLVAALLDSPQYGERWGRHWLDVVRFGESDGFERNEPRKRFWHYRDWLIQSLNRDMPYDRFARMQLAGDILKPGPEGAAAAGFLVAGLHNTVVGSSERMIRLARQDELEEIVGGVGQTFLGLTVNCARCHDHKFDPIPTTEYYRMAAALDGVQFGERDVLEADAGRELAWINEELARLRESLLAIDTPARKSILAERKQKEGAAANADRPRPFATWDFEDNLRDSVGNLHGEAAGGARLEEGALVLDGRGAYMETKPLDRALEEKTLEAWALLDNLDRRGGGVMSVETKGGGVFDAIVFGEREPRRWMAGSNGFTRTKPFQAPEEQKAGSEPVHVAIVYRKDGTIAGYRNGVPYGQAYQTGFVRFEAGNSHVVFGMRHAPPGGDKMLKGRIFRANLYDRALEADAVAASAGVENNFVSDEAIANWLPPTERTRRDALKQSLAAAEQKRAELESMSKTKMYTVLARNPSAMRIHVRGSVTDFGDEVTPGGVGAVIGTRADFGLAKDASDAERRLTLAEWITGPDNSLFARVIVNRVWHYHFGAGIVDTPNDLGFNGGRPSHPELLDWLAATFRSGGYRLKTLHRLVVMSATYRQASSINRDAFLKDAGNRWLWRFSPHRIEGEVLRDSILKVAGMLNAAQGGPGFEDVTITPNNGTTYYEPIDPEGDSFNRRTVYRFSPRGGRSPVLDTFDCPDPSTAAPRRSVTTTPLQALSLLNNSFVLRMADRFADRIRKEIGGDAREQAGRAWQLALCRLPDAEEERLSVRLISDHGLAALCRGLFNSNEFIVIE